jgi:Holliday junction resolvase
MSPRLSDPLWSREAEFEGLLADVFRQGGWLVTRQPPDKGRRRPDLVAEKAGKKYLFEFKRSSEGRRDRVIPLLAQAILEVQKMAEHFPGPVVPVAVVVANHIPDLVVEHVKRFAREHAPGVAVGLMDSEGLRAFHGYALERFNAQRSRARDFKFGVRSHATPQLFSDLSQWMLKVMLAPSIPEFLLSAPRGKYQGASQLAKAAGVSMMSAFRFLDQLSKEGFLDDRNGALQLVRIQELTQRWLAASRRSVPEIPVRWILRQKRNPLPEALRAYVEASTKAVSRPRKRRSDRLLGSAPRVSLGLFAAAEALGFGFVHGVPPHFYLERFESVFLEQVGLSTIAAEAQPDAYIRVPRNNESVFRAAVLRDGIPICDIIQVWLDVSHHPSRGKDQADLIWKRVLAPAIDKEGR